MEDMPKSSRSQLLNFTRDSYLERTSRPIYALIFLLPFIIFYEVGTLLLNTDVLDQSQVRVVAFVWLQRGLEYLGLGGKFAWIAPPLFVVIILLGLQITSKKSWRFFFNDIWPMIVECILLSVPLIVLSLFLNTSSGANANSAVSGFLAKAEVAVRHSVLADVVTGIGAGIYEELIFRLMLICLFMMLLQDVLRLSHRNSVVIAIVLSAALFSAHHHVLLIDGQVGRFASFNWTVFVFRTIAGIYFAVLFAVRGFGIAAGTHAFYDIIATLINAVFFLKT